MDIFNLWSFNVKVDKCCGGCGVSPLPKGGLTPPQPLTCGSGRQKINPYAPQEFKLTCQLSSYYDNYFFDI